MTAHEHLVAAHKHLVAAHENRVAGHAPGTSVGAMSDQPASGKPNPATARHEHLVAAQKHMVAAREHPVAGDAPGTSVGAMSAQPASGKPNPATAYENLVAAHKYLVAVHGRPLAVHGDPANAGDGRDDWGEQYDSAVGGDPSIESGNGAATHGAVQPSYRYPGAAHTGAAQDVQAADGHPLEGKAAAHEHLVAAHEDLVAADGQVADGDLPAVAHKHLVAAHEHLWYAAHKHPVAADGQGAEAIPQFSKAGIGSSGPIRQVERTPPPTVERSSSFSVSSRGIVAIVLGIVHLFR